MTGSFFAFPVILPNHKNKHILPQPPREFGIKSNSLNL